jgi:ribosome-associated protein
MSVSITPRIGTMERTADQESTPGQGTIVLAPGVEAPATAVVFSYVASAGPGGQNVNKRATRAELRAPLAAIPLDPGARSRLAVLLGRRLTESGEIVITSGEHRSQAQNRRECLDRLRALILRALVPPRPRGRTRPTRGSVERRLESKRRRGEAKRSRREAE